MRLIDADAFKPWIDEYVSVFKKSDKAEIKGYISHQPSIDICFCKECVKHKTHRCHMAFDLIATEDDDFCSYGEREGE